MLRPFHPLLREAAPHVRRCWARVRRWSNWPRLARLRQLERELPATDMRLPEIVIERLLLERSP